MELRPENSFFTPECLKPLAFTLFDVSWRWAEALGQYRRSKNCVHIMASVRARGALGWEHTAIRDTVGG